MFYLLKNLLLLIFLIFKLKCNNLIFNEIMILNASYVCLQTFSLHRESPDSDPERRDPHFKGGSIIEVQFQQNSMGGRAATTTGREEEAGLASRACACEGCMWPHMLVSFFKRGRGDPWLALEHLNSIRRWRKM
jgi:hypothetical protein